MNETLHRLPSGQRNQWPMGHALPHVPVVRRPADRPAAGDAASKQRNQGPQHTGAERLDGIRPQRSGVAQLGQGKDAAAADWKWACFGIRKPEPGETELSLEEVRVAIEIGEAWDMSDEIDTWPVKRVRRAAGTWGIYSPGLRRAQPFDGLIHV